MKTGCCSCCPDGNPTKCNKGPACKKHTERGTAMTALERADVAMADFFDVNTMAYHGDIRESIAVQIKQAMEQAKREAIQETVDAMDSKKFNDHILVNSFKAGFNEGFSAAREQAAKIADDCKQTIVGREIHARIEAMKPEAEGEGA